MTELARSVPSLGTVLENEELGLVPTSSVEVELAAWMWVSSCEQGSFVLEPECRVSQCCHPTPTPPLPPTGKDEMSPARAQEEAET